MYEYMFSGNLEWRLAGFIVGAVVAIFVVNIVIRKLVGVKRKKYFSYNHVNDFHKKADWTLRVLAVIGITLLYMFAFESFQISLLILFIVFAFLQEGLRAVMEKRYAENPKDYLFTIVQMPASLIIIFGMAWLSFPDLFPVLFEELF